ncbi:hypothetical protein BZG36_04567 [Bifiguratus adelaidae]|uniref:Uncharacterized protein n=1 Tax=Bifiguratus adelaidae TaxID=1938954 RepID=A0A261XX73_9FUNG|nr:hypothetical protein BZG36_04567 [Bifiguratus adelaidae]
MATIEGAALIDLCAKADAVKVREFLLGNPTFDVAKLRDTAQRTALFLACSQPDPTKQEAASLIARMLIMRGADVDSLNGPEQFTPLHASVFTSNVDCILLLLEAEATIPVSGPFRLTPLLLVRSKLENMSSRWRHRRSISSGLDAASGYAPLPDLGPVAQITEILTGHINTNYHPSMSSATLPPPSTSNAILPNRRSVPAAQETIATAGTAAVNQGTSLRASAASTHSAPATNYIDILSRDLSQMDCNESAQVQDVVDNLLKRIEELAVQ